MGSSRTTRHSLLSTGVSGAAADYTLFLAVVAVLGASLVLVRGIAYGPGLDHDSLFYFSTARSLLAGEGFFDYKEEPLISWPPLYPLTLAAAAGLTRFGPPAAVAGPINAAIFGLTVFAAGLWLRRRLESRLLAVWAACALALSIPLGDVAAWALSEPMFILFTILALIRTDTFLTGGKTRSLLAAAAYGALAWQARYIGAAVPFFVGLLLLCRGGGLPRRAMQAAAVWLAAGLPMALWLLRNFLYVGKLADVTGARLPGDDYPLPLFLRQAGGILRGWADFDLPWVAAAALGAAAAAVAGWRAASPCGAVSPARLARPTGGLLLLFGGFALTYFILFIAAMASGGASDGVYPRFLAPLYIPLLMTAAVALDRLCRAGRRSPNRRIASRLAAAAVAAALCLWTAGQAAVHARRIVRAIDGEQAGSPLPNYAEPRWVDSEILRYIRENPMHGGVYTNVQDHLLFFHNRGAAEYRELYTAADYRLVAGILQSEPAAAGQERLEARLAEAPEGAWVVWYEVALTDSLVGYGRAWLGVSPRLETAAELADGGIYRVRKDAPPRANPYRAALHAARQSASRQVTGRESGGFDIFRRGGDLIYIKESCSAEEARMHVVLHVYPADRADLPVARKRHGFHNLDFFFPEYGVVEAGACAAIRPLPDYAIERIETGQYESGEDMVWQSVLPSLPPGA